MNIYRAWVGYGEYDDHEEHTLYVGLDWNTAVNSVSDFTLIGWVYANIHPSDITRKVETWIDGELVTTNDFGKD